MILCTIIVGTVFTMSKIAPSSFDNLKTHFNMMMQTDMTAKEVFTYFTKAVKTIFILQESDKDKAEPTSAAGGEDITVFAAIQNTLFSPYTISADVCVPVNGEITSGFGYRIHPITKKWGFHTGLDISAAEGTKIKCAYYGVVAEVGYNSLAGNYIIVKHNDNLLTKYLHCQKVLVKENTTVRQGEVIGLVGSTGSSTGPHLHFEIVIDGKRVNPLYVFNVHDGRV
ncbi:hypothetical protein SDC9_119650 [bioreactor metagenome]|uniref:M23ase beta-sheet core domain-containing protein n=1 Tax=bioreactor metagenome TaxID=1076179 RepID=A0A645C9I1_9ZZZZ